MTLQGARTEATKQSKRGTRHVVFDQQLADFFGDTNQGYAIGTAFAMTHQYAGLEQDDILFVYRDGKEY